MYGNFSANRTMPMLILPFSAQTDHLCATQIVACTAILLESAAGADTTTTTFGGQIFPDIRMICAPRTEALSSD